MRTLEKFFIRNTCIGELEWSEDSDFPWAKGRFIPNEYYNEFNQYFTCSNNSRELDAEKLLMDGYSYSDLQILADNEEISYLYTLILDDDFKAYWRFGFEPLE